MTSTMRYEGKLCAHSSDENYDAGVGCAFVVLTQKLARLMLRRLMTFAACEKMDGSLSEMRWMGDYVDWTGRQVDDAVDVPPPDTVIEALDKLDEGEGYVLLPSDCPLPEDAAARVECNEMLIEGAINGVGFTCLIKYTETRMTSDKIPLAVIEKAAGIKRKAKAKAKTDTTSRGFVARWSRVIASL